MKNLNLRKIIASILVVGAFVLLAIWYFIFYRPTHYKRDVANEKAITISAIKLSELYASYEDSANRLFLNKAVEVNGKMIFTEQNQEGNWVITLQGVDDFTGVQCTLQPQVKPSSDSVITVKGICTGILSNVIIKDAFIVEKQ